MDAQGDTSNLKPSAHILTYIISLSGRSPERDFHAISPLQENNLNDNLSASMVTSKLPPVNRITKTKMVKFQFYHIDCKHIMQNHSIGRAYSL